MNVPIRVVTQSYINRAAKEALANVFLVNEVGQGVTTNRHGPRWNGLTTAGLFKSDRIWSGERGHVLYLASNNNSVDPITRVGLPALKHHLDMFF